MNQKIKIVKRSINSKLLFEKVHTMIFETITSLGVKWTSESHRKSFARAVGDFMFGLIEEGEIERFKVICDKRNNKSFSSDAESYCFEVNYKQPSCLNTSRIEYHIKNK